jgi:hypothetical protein
MVSKDEIKDSSTISRHLEDFARWGYHHIYWMKWMYSEKRRTPWFNTELTVQASRILIYTSLRVAKDATSFFYIFKLHLAPFLMFSIFALFRISFWFRRLLPNYYPHGLFKADNVNMGLCGVIEWTSTFQPHSELDVRFNIQPERTI